MYRGQGSAAIDEPPLSAPTAAMSDAPQLPPGPRRITSSREKAKMTYLPPDLDVDALVADTPNFKAIPRLDATQFETKESFASLEDLIQQHVISGGTPLVIENWHKRSDWPWYIFNPQWLKDNHGADHINVRDLNEAKDVKMSLQHYLQNLPKLASRFTPHDYYGKQQRLYAKDIDCPLVWRDKLQAILPPSTFYLSAQGDLMSSLPEPARAENMMCYFGHEGTYTPAHKEMCASLGQNIMVHASSGDAEPGTSIWFMTHSSDRDVIAEYWLSRMGHDIEVEAHFASIQDLQDAPFTVYIHEQRVGDYILVPPLAPHQVWNRGEETLKAAWNRITVDTLELALSESLPKARLVCRDEQYKNRAIVYETLKEYCQILNGEKAAPHMDMGRMGGDFVRLFRLFDRIMLDECFSPEASPPAVEKIDNEYNVTCSFCRGNIWNRFLSCKNCIQTYEGEEDCYDICMDCYARGRSCYCVSKLDWVEQHDWKVLQEDHDEFRRTVLDILGASIDSPLPLSRGIKQLGRKSLARVCQEQLEVRPWQDMTKNDPGGELIDEDIEGKKKDDRRCHVCKVRHDAWKCAECTTCTTVYCYGNLWRAFDMDPFENVLCKFVWSCPVCLGFCSCSACRKKGGTRPYEPKGTFLGAPTKHVADPRSVETLVDFARGNLGWIKNPAKIMPGKRKRASTTGLDHPGPAHNTTHRGLNHGQVPIDPALDDRERPSPSGFTAVNSPSEIPFADVEGRFLPASTEGEGEPGSNSYGSVQALLSIAQQVRIREGEASGEGGLNQNQGLLYGEPNAMGRDAVIGSAAGRIILASHRNSNISNQTHCPPLGSNVASRGGRLPPGSASDDQSRTIPSLTALESNPLAFVAAAGLLQLPGGDSNPWGDTTAMASQPPRELCTQPHLLERRPPPSSSSATPTPEPPPRPLPRRPRVKTELSFGLNSLRPERESQIGDWVRKTKVANSWAKNLKKKKTLVVTLRPPLDGFSTLVDELLEREKVTSDLFSTAPGQFVTVRESGGGGAAGLERARSPPWEEVLKVKRKRGRRIDHDTDPLSDTDEGSFSDAGIGVSPGPGGKEQARSRRREAYLRRRKEEDEAKAEFLSSSHHGAAKQEVFTMFKHQPGQFKEDMSDPQPPPVETEEERLARGACEEEELQRRVAEEEASRIQHETEKAALEAERLRIRAEEEAALETERLRVRAEEKAAGEAARAKLRAEENEAKRREADRNAKLVAAGLLASSDVEEYIFEPSSISDPDSEAEKEEGLEELQVPSDLDASEYSFHRRDNRTPIPHHWSFAVVIDPATGCEGWRDSYTFFRDLPLDRSPLSATHSAIRTAPAPTPRFKRPRGRPRKGTPLPSHSNLNRPATPSTAKKHRKHRRKSESHDASFKAGGVVLAPPKERDRRQSAVGVKKYSFDDHGEDGGLVRKAVVVKKRRIRKVEVKPGKWAEVEITESEDEGEGGDVVQEPPLADPGFGGWEAGGGLGGGAGEERSSEKQVGQEGAEGTGMELGNEYERRWNREKRRRWF